MSPASLIFVSFAEEGNTGATTTFFQAMLAMRGSSAILRHTAPPIKAPVTARDSDVRRLEADKKTSPPP